DVWDRFGSPFHLCPSPYWSVSATQSHRAGKRWWIRSPFFTTSCMTWTAVQPRRDLWAHPTGVTTSPFSCLYGTTTVFRIGCLLRSAQTGTLITSGPGD